MRNINRHSVGQFSSLELFARQVVEGFLTGMHKSPFHGFSVEFAEHRQYNRGESIRHIDWKLYGRTEKLFVKKYEEETNLRCQLVLDVSSSMYFPFDQKESEPGRRNKLDFSVHAAASLSHLFQKQRDAVGLTTISDRVETHLPARGSSKHRQHVYQQLDDLLSREKMNQKSNLTATLHELADTFPKRSMVILFTDMFDSYMDSSEEFFSALQHLRYNQHEVILFNVLYNDLEVELNYEDRPYTFIDPETGESLKLNPMSLREKYRKRQLEFEHEVDVKCGQYHVDYNAVDIAEGFYPVLLSFLSKRAKMK
jgi:uncharacterized protein (DUF58 family)